MLAIEKIPKVTFTTAMQEIIYRKGYNCYKLLTIMSELREELSVPESKILNHYTTS